MLQFASELEMHRELEMCIRRGKSKGGIGYDQRAKLQQIVEETRSRIAA